jgi:hypothetical protein
MQNHIFSDISVGRMSRRPLKVSHDPRRINLDETKGNALEKKILVKVKQNTALKPVFLGKTCPLYIESRFNLVLPDVKSNIESW